MGDRTGIPTAGPDRVVPRPNTTFKPRRRAMSAKRQGEFERWMQTWGLDEGGAPLIWRDVFRGADLDHAATGETTREAASETKPILDIGFGRGEATVEMARADRSTPIVGIEVHTPGVVAVLDAIENDPLPHVRVVHGDVLCFLVRVPLESLGAVRVYFPDPWNKKRQHQRRLIRADVLTALVDRLAIGGCLHLATDISHYADEMQSVCDSESRLDGGVIDRPSWRPMTRFEQRGLDEGRRATDLLYTRTV